MLQLWSLEIEDFVEEVLVSLDPIQHTTPTSTKLGASETVPFRVVLLGDFFAIPVMRRPEAATLEHAHLPSYRWKHVLYTQHLDLDGASIWILGLAFINWKTHMNQNAPITSKKLNARKDQTSIFSSFTRSASEVYAVFLSDSLDLKKTTTPLFWTPHILFPQTLFGKKTLWQQNIKKHNPRFQRWGVVWRYSYHSHQLESIESNSVSPIPIEPDREDFVHRGIVRLTPVGSQLLSQICIVAPIVCYVLSSLTLALSQSRFVSKRWSIESKSTPTCQSKYRRQQTYQYFFSARSLSACQSGCQRTDHQI